MSGHSPEYAAARRADPAYRERQLIWNRAYHEAHKDDAALLARKAAQMRGYSDRPEIALKRKARRLLRSAIEKGLLSKQPCERCGIESAHGHHDDYAKPLAVRWLCRLHHDEHHAKAEGWS